MTIDQRRMTSAEHPSVAVVIPCFNAERYVSRAIQSVIEQQYPSMEIFAVDDGSKDNTLDAIRSFDGQVRWSTGANRGACEARNQGLWKTDTKYVLFLDADDFIEGSLIASLVDSADVNEADICFGPAAVEYQDKRRSSRTRPNTRLPHSSCLAEILSKDAWVPPHSLLWRSEFIKEIGGWKRGCLRNQDGELLFRAFLAKPRMAQADFGLAVYVQHDDTDRVSKRASKTVLGSQIDDVIELSSAVMGTEFVGVLPVLGKSAYRLASRCFYLGYRQEGRRALSHARECGFDSHIGSRLHCAASAAVGLETKQAISRAIHHAKWAMLGT